MFTISLQPTIVTNLTRQPCLHQPHLVNPWQIFSKQSPDWSVFCTPAADI